MFDLSGYPYKAIIFDCDGTIANNMPLHFDGWVHGLKVNGAKFHLETEEILSLAGVGIEKIVGLFNEKYGENLDPLKVSEAKESYFKAHSNSVEIIPEIEAVIRKHQGKFPMAVASGSRTESVNHTLKHLKLEGIFDPIVTVDHVKNGKPAPDMFLLAAEKMGVSPSDCIVFEDGELGIQAAEAAGMKCYRVNSRL